jgi:hypothetical protein
MNNVTFIEIQNSFDDGKTIYAIVERGNGEFTSMLKADYEAQQTANTLPSNSADRVEKPAK